jgi:tRNA-binding protein
MLAWETFSAVDMRVGTVLRAEAYPEAQRPAIKLWIDFGPELGQRKSSAQLTHHYTPESLVGRQVVAVVNFAPKQVGKFMSECLVLGAVDQVGAVVLLHPDIPVANGLRIA